MIENTNIEITKVKDPNNNKETRTISLNLNISVNVDPESLGNREILNNLVSENLIKTLDYRIYGEIKNLIRDMIFHIKKYIRIDYTNEVDKILEPLVKFTQEDIQNILNTKIEYKEIVKPKKIEVEELWDADPDCDHHIVCALGGGVKCTKCSGWMCY